MVAHTLILVNQVVQLFFEARGKACGDVGIGALAQVFRLLDFAALEFRLSASDNEGQFLLCKPLERLYLF